MNACNYLAVRNIKLELRNIKCELRNVYLSLRNVNLERMSINALNMLNEKFYQQYVTADEVCAF